MARGFSRGGGGGGRSGGSGGGFSFGGGGRSSSSGGGFSFGFGGGSSSSRRYDRHDDYHHHHYHHRPRGPWHVPIFGRTVIVSTRARSVFSFLMMLFAISCFMCVIFCRFASGYGANIKEQKLLIAEYETRDKDYKKLIQGAKDGIYEVQEFDISEFYRETTKTFKYTHYSGQSDPTETGIYDMNLYRDGQEYFFIVYSYKFGGVESIDWTFAQYTKYQLEDIIRKGGKIKIAVGELTDTASNDDGVYAMNMDYTLEANQEYQYEVYTLNRYKSSRTKYVLIAVGSALVMAAIVAGVVVYIVKKYKAAQVKQELENKKTEAEIAEAQAKAEIAEAQANKVNRNCVYCGCDIPDNEDVCPACGSRQFEKDND